MKKTILSVLLLSITAIAGAQTITIAKQGHFSVGGQTIQRPGAYDNSKFVGWAEQEETGQSYRADHGPTPATCSRMELLRKMYRNC